ncbi:COP1-interactive protein 1-like [Nicotiana tomentosiformis]|uniref:COP1-interactive protein 1-like n=1 Tax=Nicotiana tomentosiformis TaxID=4098 RepID=UPI00388C674F
MSFPEESAPWMPQAVPDLEDWVQKLASTSSYAERAWRDLVKGVTKDAILRPSSGEEGTKSPVPEPGKDKKRKAISRPENPKPKTRRVRRKAIALSMDSVQRLREKEEDDTSALVIRSAKAIEVARLSELMPEALKEARELKTPNMDGGSSVGDPFQDCFTGVDDASDISDTSLLLEEAQCFISRAISRFRVDLSQCEAELQKVSGEKDALRLLCSQKDDAIKDLYADLAKAHEEEAELDKHVSLVLLEYGFDPTVEANPSLSQLQQKLRSVKQKGSAQAKRIKELETRLAEAKAEVESSKVMADKSITVYRADAEAAQMEARETANTADTRAHWVAELAKCRSRRETLKEIHARGFDLAEDIKRAKELEAEPEALAFDDDDNEGSKSGSEGGGGREPGGEETALDDNQKLSP